MDITPLQQGYRTLLDAAAAVTAGAPDADPPAGEWNANQILAHVALVDAATIAAAAAVAAGVHPSYDNRVSLDMWTIERIIGIAGGSAGLQERIRQQGIALGALVGEILSEHELDTAIPTRLLSGGELQLDQPIALRELITGIATDHLPRHAEQLLALLSDDARTAAARTA